MSDMGTSRSLATEGLYADALAGVAPLNGEPEPRIGVWNAPPAPALPVLLGVALIPSIAPKSPILAPRFSALLGFNGVCPTPSPAAAAAAAALTLEAMILRSSRA